MVNRNRIVQEFCRLVAVDAIPFHERAMADLLKQELLGLGFEVYEDQAGEEFGSNCGNVYGFLKGELEGEPLLFSAHMDTVEPGLNKKAMVKEDGTIVSDGTTVLGADDVAGLVSILEAVRVLLEKGIPHRSIEVLFPIAEEVYIQGSRVFDYGRIKAKEAYVLDLDGPVGTAATKAPTLVSFTSKIIGKASHAGFAPEQGIHAIAIAAEAITRIQQGRIDGDMTVNIGTIEGGKGRNIVPEECVIKGEVRSLNHEQAVTYTKKIQRVLDETVAKYHTVQEFDSSFGCIAYEVYEQHPVVRRFQRACRTLNCPVHLIETFGGSDNNNFLMNGITGIVLSCGMNAVHSLKEYTQTEELVRCCNIVLQLMTASE